MSSALLIKERTEAEVRIYPCTSQCCLEQDMSPTKDTRPLKLQMTLSRLNRFEFSLFREDKKLLFSTQDLPSSRVADSLRNGSISCRMFLFIANQLIKISLHTPSGFAGDVLFQPSQYSHPEQLLGSLKCQPSGAFEDGMFIDDVPGGRNAQPIWMNHDLNVSSATQPIFDDRKAINLGLSGAFHWDGLRLGQIIAVNKLKFWLHETYIAGFQATYTIDGFRLLGPRNGFLNDPKRFRTRVFELVDGENISCIYALSNICGYLVRVFFVTDRGRSFALATAAPAVSERTKLVLRHPNAKVIGFRGSFQKGLVNFGIICELEKQIAERISEGLVCYVCGAHSAYFAGLYPFRRHVDSCLEHFMNSRHQSLLPNETCPKI